MDFVRKRTASPQPSQNNHKSTIQPLVPNSFLQPCLKFLIKYVAQRIVLYSQNIHFFTSIYQKVMNVTLILVLFAVFATAYANSNEGIVSSKRRKNDEIKSHAIRAYNRSRAMQVMKTARFNLPNRRAKKVKSSKSPSTKKPRKLLKKDDYKQKISKASTKKLKSSKSPKTKKPRRHLKSKRSL